MMDAQILGILSGLVAGKCPWHCLPSIVVEVTYIFVQLLKLRCIQHASQMNV